jgi:hypothetical protein
VKIIKCDKKEMVDIFHFVEDNKGQLGRIKQVIITQKDGMSVLGEGYKILLPFCGCGDEFGHKYDPNYGERTAVSIAALGWLDVIKEDEDQFEGLSAKIHGQKEVKYSC